MRQAVEDALLHPNRNSNAMLVRQEHAVLPRLAIDWHGKRIGVLFEYKK